MFLTIVGAFTVATLSIRLLGIFWEFYVLCIRCHFSKNNSQLREKFGDWAVVTGSTDGIGKRYAIELAKRSINVVLISRNPEKLKKVANEIEEQYRVETKIVEADFSRGSEVYSHIQKELQGIPVGILVNNVGVLDDYPVRVCDVPMEKIWEMINVNVMTVATMTRMLLPGMVERNQGAVVNISSFAGANIIPMMSVYSGTKAFMRSFTLALQEEYSHTNIDINYLCPAFVASNMTSFSNFLCKGNFLVPNATEYVNQAINALGNLPYTSGYWTHILQEFYFNCLPRRVAVNIIYTLMKYLENEHHDNMKLKNE